MENPKEFTFSQSKSSSAWRDEAFKRACLAVASCAFLLAIFNFSYRADSLFILADSGLFILALTMAYRLHHNIPVSMAFRVASVVMGTLFINIVTFQYTASSGLIVWNALLPLLYYLSFGKRFGFQLCIMLAILVTLITTLRQFIPGHEMPMAMIVNSIFAYVLVWVIAHIYESSREKQALQLEEMALTDSLTQAFNRQALRLKASAFCPKTEASMWLWLVDVDDFKQINDRYGHESGDKVLVELVSLLKASFGANNVFRLGGEEFALLSEHTPAEQVLQQANALCHRVRQHPIEIDDTQLTISLSIGLASNGNNAPLSKILKRADLALYDAKAAGKNQACLSRCRLSSAS